MATLTVSFTPPVSPPANGYRVRYWLASDPSNIFTVSPNPSSSPVNITGLSGSAYQGTIEADCGAGLYSSLTTFSSFIADPCTSGTTLATANCSSGQTSTFTLATGFSTTVNLYGFYYSGTGTRTITGALLNNSNSVIQAFTYTQTGAGAGVTSPSFYTLTNTSGSAVTYKLQIDTVNCTNGTGVGSMTVGSCISTNPSVVVSNAAFSGVTISAVSVNGVAVTYESGVNLPISFSGLGYFRTNQIGTFNITVSYSNPALSSPRVIRLTGSNGVAQTQTAQASSSTLTFTNVVVNTSQSVQIAVLQS
jgi:hypothetical protein